MPNKRRTRSKSTSIKNLEEPTETAPNLNGNKDGVNDEETSPSEKQTEIRVEAETPDTSPKVTRKRKASEMRSESSGGEESQSADKETKEVIEPELKEDSGNAQG